MMGSMAGLISVGCVGLMTLKYKGGEVKVLVPSEVLVVNRIVTDRSALKPGTEVSLQGSRMPTADYSKSDYDPGRAALTLRFGPRFLP